MGCKRHLGEAYFILSMLCIWSFAQVGEACLVDNRRQLIQTFKNLKSATIEPKYFNCECFNCSICPWAELISGILVGFKSQVFTIAKRLEWPI